MKIIDFSKLKLHSFREEVMFTVRRDEVLWAIFVLGCTVITCSLIISGLVGVVYLLFKCIG